MHFTLHIRSEATHEEDFSYGLVFIPCPVWMKGSRQVLNLNPERPELCLGSVERLIEKEGLGGKLKGKRAATILVHSIGHGSYADLTTLKNDLRNQNFVVTVYGETTEKELRNILRIGTWNLEGKWTDGHHDLLLSGKCDIWLLTEVNSKAIDEQGRVAGFHCHHTHGEIAPNRYWAAILSREPAKGLPDPHPASAAADVDGITFCSSVLPWRTCGEESPWVGKDFDEKVKNAVESLMSVLKQSNLVWGGDWNQSLVGTEFVGSYKGREFLQATLKSREFKVPTECLLSQQEKGCHTVDHVAIPSAWSVVGEPSRIPAGKLSDHDAYVIEVVRPAS